MIKPIITVVLASVSVVAVLGVVSLAAVTGVSIALDSGDKSRQAAAPVRSKSLVFDPVPVPVTDAAKRANVATNRAVIDSRSHAIGYQLIARSGQKIGSGVFGREVDQHGQPLKNRKGRERITNRADFSSLLKRGENFYAVTHFETTPGLMYLTQLIKDRAGNFTPLNTRPIDFSKFGGLWAPCAGVVTPWNTHLGSEEKPPDARAVEGWTELKRGLGKLVRNMLPYFNIDWRASGTTLETVRAAFNPYNYGYPVEVAVDQQGNTMARKHYAMGRSSLELAYVMPDRRTVYMADDRRRGGFFMFIADKPADLSKGRLYAARWIQQGDKNGGRARLDWVDLGHAKSDDVAKSIRQRIKFTDLFVAGDQVDEKCADGLTAVTGGECLRLRPGREMLASRLETNRYAALKGATTEFSKPEGIAYDANGKTLYLAMATISRSMEDFKRHGKPSRKYDSGGPNHIRLPYNACGAIYGLTVGRDRKIGSDYVAKTMQAVVAGRMKSYPEDGELALNGCDVDGIAGPDNLTFIDGHGTLIIAEDTSRGHQNDALWAFNVKTKALTRIQTTPYGSEVTSSYWYPNLDGHGYLMSVVQHPYGESDGKKLRTPDEAAAYVGYIGPFPKMD